MALIHEIPITEVKGLFMGHAQDQEAKTGVTVLLFDKDRGAVISAVEARLPERHRLPRR